MQLKETKEHLNNFGKFVVQQARSRLSKGKKNVNKKWGWYQSVFSLSQGDIRRFKNITQLNVHECLYALSFMKEKADLESKQMKSKFKR